MADARVDESQSCAHEVAAGSDTIAIRRVVFEVVVTAGPPLLVEEAESTGSGSGLDSESVANLDSN